MRIPEARTVELFRNIIKQKLGQPDTIDSGSMSTESSSYQKQAVGFNPAVAQDKPRIVGD